MSKNGAPAGEGGPIADHRPDGSDGVSDTSLQRLDDVDARMSAGIAELDKEKAEMTILVDSAASWANAANKLVDTFLPFAQKLFDRPEAVGAEPGTGPRELLSGLIGKGLAATPLGGMIPAGMTDSLVGLVLSRLGR